MSRVSRWRLRMGSGQGTCGRLGGGVGLFRLKPDGTLLAAELPYPGSSEAYRSEPTA